MNTEGGEVVDDNRPIEALIVKMTAKIKHLDEMLDDAFCMIARLEQANADATSTIEQLRADSDAKDRSHQATIADLQAQLSAKDSELTAQAAVVAELRDEVVSTRVELQEKTYEVLEERGCDASTKASIVAARAVFPDGVDATKYDAMFEHTHAVQEQRRKVEANMGDAAGWWGLYSLLTPDEVIEVNGTTLARHDCCIRILEIDNLNVEAWLVLGQLHRTMSANMPRTLVVRGTPYTFLQCLEMGVNIDPSLASSWMAAGIAMGPKMTIVVGGSTTYSQGGCISKAIELGTPRDAFLWYTLGHIVAREGPVVVNDITYSTKEECDAKAKQTHRS